MTARSNLSAAFEQIRQQLACPACYGELRLSEQSLTCSGCGRLYPVVDGIPVLIPAPTRSAATD